MKKALTLLLLLCLLAGCGSRSAESAVGSTMTVYRVYTGSEAGELIQPESCPLSPGQKADVDTALELFMREPKHGDLRAAVAPDVTLQSGHSQNGLITLDFSENFRALSPMDQSLAAFCATLTLCALEDVDAVTVTAGGETIFQGLSAEDALLQDTDSDPYTRRLRLYFADGDGRWLVSEYHSLSLDENASLERYVMEELLRGPNDPDLHSPVPAGTQLLSCSTENGVCTVDLSAEFVQNRPQTALGERLAVWSVVNSLAVLSDVDSVRILCEGQSIDRYVCRSLAEPLMPLRDAIGPPSAAKGEQELTLCLATEDLSALAALPYAVDPSGFSSLPEAAAAALCEAQEPGFAALFSPGCVLSVTGSGSVCIADVTESFFAALEPSQRDAAVRSLAATLLFAGDYALVRITVSGADAVFEGQSYAGPWTENDIRFTE